MNKKSIIRLFSAVAVALMGIGCQADSFNEQYLPGYDNNGAITNVRDLEFTLTADDYSAIAKNSVNKVIAADQGEEAVAALAAIGSNKYFSGAEQAALYVPAYLDNLYNTLDNGSTALVTYTTATNVPEDVVVMNAAAEYTLTDADYKTIWGSETDYANALTPKTVNKLASVLPHADDARVGDYVVVTYNYSAEEPSTGETPGTPDTPGSPEAPAVSFSSVLGTAKLNDAVEVVGYISAISKQGPILSDKGGSLLLYDKGWAVTPDLVVGDIVTVSGIIASHNFGFQIDASTATIEKIGTTTVVHPVAKELDGAAMDALIESRTEDGYAEFVKFKGTAAIEKYINITMDGATTAQGSIYGATDEVAAMFTNGEEATIYGYFVSISSGKFINVVVVSVNEEPAMGEMPDAPATPGEPDAPAAKYTSVFGAALVGDMVEVEGYISALSSMGPIVTDNGGSALFYDKGLSVTADLAVGDEVTVSGTISAYNNGLQLDASKGATIEKTGTMTVTYPTPMDITGAKADELLTSHTAEGFGFYAEYAKMTGKVVVTTSGDKTYYNFEIAGATSATGSIYGITDALKSELTDGLECTLYGYFLSISRVDKVNPKYVNMIVTSCDKATPKASKMALKVKSEKRYAYFKLGEAGYVAADIVAVQPSDYTAMGQTHGNFSNSAQDRYLPLFLAQKYPYAQIDDKLYVGYRCYADDVTRCRVDEYIFDGAWTKIEYFTDKTDQFRKDAGAWQIDPTLELDFTSTSSAETKAFYQYCCNWVYDFMDVPLGAPARDNAGEIISTEIVLINGEKPAGNYWVSNYGNNEFYTGASAYYGNMDWRPSACKGGFAAAGLGELSDDEILAALKEHSTEVFAAVLGYMYPEMTPQEYKKVVIKVYAYGPNKNYAFSFDVVEKGMFSYVADSLVEL